MGEPSPLFVSVIIPVYNDARRLTICLRALEQQTYPAQAYEILVVDNNSDDPIASVVSEFRHVRVAQEAQTGQFVARNTGIALARGEVLAFTDSDCRPAPDWIEQGVAALVRVPNCGLVGGKITLFFHDPAQPTLVELFDDVVTGFDQRAYIEKRRFAATANMFTYKRVCAHVGGFDPALKSRGDYEWGKRVAACGYPLVYADDAEVAHPARRSFAELHQRMIRFTGGFEDLYQKNPALFSEEDRQEFSFSLTPALRTFLVIWRSRKITAFQKIKLTLLGLVVKCIKLKERCRLKLGGHSTRL